MSGASACRGAGRSNRGSARKKRGRVGYRHTQRGRGLQTTRAAVLNRGNTNSGSDVIDLAGAKNVTLDHLSLTGGYIGLLADNNAGSSGDWPSSARLSIDSRRESRVSPTHAVIALLNDCRY